MLRNIFLYGLLEKEFGRKWELDVESPQEAARAINANTRGKFLNFVRNMNLSVVRGSDLNSGEVITKEMININYGKGDFHICPVAEGSGPALLIGVIIGSLLIGGIMYLTMPSIRPEDSMEDDQKGYQFSGRSESVNQGVPLPLAYGEVFIGPTVISQGIKAEEIV